MTWAQFEDYADLARAFMVETRLYATTANGSRQPVPMAGRSREYAQAWAEGQTRCTRCRTERALAATAAEQEAALQATDLRAQAVEILRSSSDPQALCAAFEVLGDGDVERDVYLGAWRRLTRTAYFRAPFEAVQLTGRRSLFSWKPVEHGMRTPLWTAVFEDAYRDEEYGTHGHQRRIWLSADGGRVRVAGDGKPPWDGRYVLPAGATPQAVSSKDDSLRNWTAGAEKSFATLERCYGLLRGESGESAGYVDIRRAVLDGYERQQRRGRRPPQPSI